jgi:hypothetical protein
VHPVYRSLPSSLKEVLSLAGFESVTFNLFVTGVEPSGFGYTEYHNPAKEIVPGVVGLYGLILFYLLNFA